MMKKLIVVAAAALVAAGAQAASYKDGSYTGEGKAANPRSRSRSTSPAARSPLSRFSSTARPT